MPFEKIRALVPHGLTREEQVSRLKHLATLHAALLDRLVSNTDRPKGKKPGFWPCLCYDEIRMLMGEENFNEIFNDVAAAETCHDRRAKLTLSAANKRYHSLPPHIQAAVVEQLRQTGHDILACQERLGNHLARK